MNEPYAIEMKNITKIFKNIIANDNINFNVQKGKIHALLGENGAGKSTLMSILFGIYKPTFGNIKIHGNEISIENTSTAKKAGIGMVHQYFKLVDEFKVWENIALSDIYDQSKFINRKAIFTKIENIMDKYNLHLDLNKKVSKLTTSDHQKIEILKILFNNANILIFDEPTAFLWENEIKNFFKLLRKLKQENKTIIFISHKFSEIMSISDNISVMREGKLIDTFSTDSKSINEIVKLMVGKKISEVKNNHNYIEDKIILDIKNLSIKVKKNTVVKNMNFNIKAGEIVAIAGVEGNGQMELLEAIVGNNKNITGQIFINDKLINLLPTYERYINNISYIADQKDSLIPEFNVLDNILLHNINIKPFVNFGFLNKEMNTYYAQKLINNYNVKGTANGFVLLKNLSGGNKQKLLVGREMEKNHKLLLAANPTKYMDIYAIEYVHKKLLLEKKRKNAILLFSTELSEIIALADRVIVMSAGEKNGELSKENITKEKIGLLMLEKENINEIKKTK